jgi:indole-3-acetate monooxygenase
MIRTETPMFNIADRIDSLAVKTVTDTDASVIRTLAAVRELDPKIRAAANEIEQGRRLPLHIVREMQRAGVFRMSMPRAWGGSELDPLSQLEVIEALSMADGSVGWCAMIGTDGGYTTAFIDQAVAREMYPDVDMVSAMTFAPPGKAVKTREGFVVNGRWPFASGCQHASWFIGHFAVFDGNSPRLDRNGLPVTRFGCLPAEECEIIDTWRTNGLRGSGSHDWAVKKSLCPRSANLQSGGPHQVSEGSVVPAPQHVLLQIFWGLPGNCPRRDRGLRRARSKQANDI